MARIAEIQARSPMWKGPASFCKTYLAWVVCNPPEGRLKIVSRYRFEGSDETYAGDAGLLEMAIINTGRPCEAESDEMMGLDALFYMRLDSEERDRTAKKIFKSSIVDLIGRRDIGMFWSMDEEYKNHWRGIWEEEERARTVSMFADTVMQLVSRPDFSLEDALSVVPEDVRDEVEKSVERRLHMEPRPVKNRAMAPMGER